MNANHKRAGKDLAITPQSRIVLAKLRPTEIKLSPIGLENSLGELVRNAPHGMALLDESGRHLEASDTYCKRLQLEKTAILGKTCRQLIPALPEKFETALSSSLAGGVSTFDDEWTSEDHGLSWKLHPWRISRRRIGGVVLFLNEVSAPAPEEQPNISQGVDEPLQDISKMEKVRRTMGSLAHDFNNILVVINGYSSILIDDLQTDPRLLTKATSIRNAGERAAKLADQLLALSRP